MSKVLISCENISKSFPDKPLFENQSFGIFEYDKIGIVGVNGSGKSTFLKIIAGYEKPDSGKVTRRNDLKIAFLPQEPNLNPNLTIIRQLFAADKEEYKILRKYHELLLKNNEKELLKIINEMDRKNLWAIEHKAEEYLTKLNLKTDKKIALLSGGEKRKLDIAGVLMSDADLLILDEPTNHLDMETIEWLQKYLTNFNGSLIFVTHDRYFLDSVSNKIMEIDAGKIKFYKGNYSFYLKQKELEEIDLKRKETRRLAQLKTELKWLHRGARARTSKPKNHLDRVKKLISNTFITKSDEMSISFQTKRIGKTVLELENISKSYKNKTLIKNFTHYFQKGEKIGIIGPNGSGKTTLLKIIAGEEKPDSGKIKVGVNTKFAYFKQDQNINNELTVIDFIKQTAENIYDERGNLHSASQMLEKFLFNSQKQYTKISALSGGEKKRLLLLKSLILGSNFIIFDEPTNDFDIKTLEILEDYLDNFSGNLLIVSHDRYFLDRTVDFLFVFEKNGIIKFPGSYSDFLLVKRYENETKEKSKKSGLKPKRQHTDKKLSYNEKRELEKIEKILPEYEKERENLLKKIEKEAATLTSKDFSEIQSEIEKLEKIIGELEERWLELSEKTE